MSLAPNQGSTGGGDEVILSGHHFTGTSDVRFGPRRATSFAVVDDTTTDATTPAGNGAVQVAVTTPGGTGVIGTFYYLPPPSIRVITPPAGPVAGGNTVLITGVGLYTTSEVRFGAQSAAFVVVSDGELLVTVPSAAVAGSVAVIVVARGGVGGGLTYAYLDAPAITAVTFDSGPVAGGNLVVITGTAFLYTTSVTFDGVPVTSYRIASDTEIDAVVPAGTVGPVDVSVTTLGGTTTALNAYTYLTSFAVLAGTTVTNTGPSVVTGDLGVSPGATITGFPPGVVNGATHAADATALQAQADLTVTYNRAAALPPDSTISGDLGGLTLAPGVYNAASTLALTGTLTLDAAGDANAAWVFQIGSTLTTASASSVLLVNGAAARNVVWQVGTFATLGTGSAFVGTILALTSITVTTGATIDGQVLARNGAVTLDTNTITRSN
ncbi:ice-binding family protein [Streptomyces sp. NPDC058405]|uniref:ice-binding family protein n=1 Tax=Streptomyces sp. NPDC058405 TaxID=3346482 RepID=UPI0036677B35